MVFSKTVLPLPFCPVTARISLGAIERFMWFSKKLEFSVGAETDNSHSSNILFSGIKIALCRHVMMLSIQ